VVGRVVLAPQELEVGIVTAFVGAPVLILLARRTKVSAL
jgi:iron complex transport system permease protein